MEHQQQYVGIDLHRRRSVIVRATAEGEVLECVRIDNDPVALSLEVAKAGPNPEVALEATYGWYWAADLLRADGANVHLVHPLGLDWDARRVKNDEHDATELAHRLRRGDLPEAWIAPTELRELRELVRYRAKLVALRTSAKAQIHGVMAKCGILPRYGDMFGPAGQQLLDEMPFEGAYVIRVESLRDLLEIYERELTMVTHELHRNPAALAVNGGRWRGLDDLEIATCGWVSWFNERRLHEALQNLTPAEYETAHYRALPQATAA